MHKDTIRYDGRTYDQLRPISYYYNMFSNAISSIILEIGNTKVLCAISIQPHTPLFLRGTGSGWLSAEYNLLPTSTLTRTVRESVSMKRNERSIEISRLIARCLRSICDLYVFGERTIMIDCDVLQADGGTRASCITGSFMALEQAQKFWLEHNVITKPFLKSSVAAISIGVLKGNPILDPDYQEDNGIDADFTFVMTNKNEVIEVQGGAEKKPLDWDTFERVRILAKKGIEELFVICNNKNRSNELFLTRSIKNVYNENKEEEFKKIPMFSLLNRQQTKI